MYLCIGFSSRDILAGSTFHFLTKYDILYDINQRDRMGRTLLMNACGQPLSVHQELLKRGADIKALDHSGNNVLHHNFLNLQSIDKQSDSGYMKYFILQGPSILRILILAGADHRHVNCHGHLPHGVFSACDDWGFPYPVYTALANCVWLEALQRSGIDPTCDAPIEASTKLQSYGDEISHCCLFHWRSLSFKQDLIHLERLAYKYQIIVILERWSTTAKIVFPLLPKKMCAWLVSKVAEVRYFVSELRTRKMEFDRAGRTGVRLRWEEPLPQSRMELHEWEEQQDLTQDFDGATCDGNSAGRDLPKSCGRCRRTVRNFFWHNFHKITSKSDTESDEESDSDTQSEEEIEEDYFSAEEV